eukprot:TRINITY_DN10606_c0_g1_i1.p1 TRINITY_DN10606_c0_g1~~TRINITY_DN10606_c0_g1_i1.p1  ORF type:complete len:509 (-),score=69.67 TRINITY_DN10606_c0_g1_i1:15-1541(-)
MPRSMEALSFDVRDFLTNLDLLSVPFAMYGQDPEVIGRIFKFFEVHGKLEELFSWAVRYEFSTDAQNAQSPITKRKAAVSAETRRSREDHENSMINAFMFRLAYDPDMKTPCCTDPFVVALYEKYRNEPDTFPETLEEHLAVIGTLGECFAAAPPNLVSLQFRLAGLVMKKELIKKFPTENVTRPFAEGFNMIVYQVYNDFPRYTRVENVKEVAACKPVKNSLTFMAHFFEKAATRTLYGADEPHSAVLNSLVELTNKNMADYFALLTNEEQLTELGAMVDANRLITPADIKDAETELAFLLDSRNLTEEISGFSDHKDDVDMCIKASDSNEGWKRITESSSNASIWKMETKQFGSSRKLVKSFGVINMRMETVYDAFKNNLLEKILKAEQIEVIESDLNAQVIRYQRRGIWALFSAREHLVCRYSSISDQSAFLISCPTRHVKHPITRKSVRVRTGFGIHLRRVGKGKETQVCFVAWDGADPTSTLGGDRGVSKLIPSFEKAILKTK